MKRALVTGAGKRLGRAMAQYLAQRGFDVAIHYAASADEAKDLAADLAQMGRRAPLLQADLNPPVGRRSGPIGAEGPNPQNGTQGESCCQGQGRENPPGRGVRRKRRDAGGRMKNRVKGVLHRVDWDCQRSQLFPQFRVRRKRLLNIRTGGAVELSVEVSRQLCVREPVLHLLPSFRVFTFSPFSAFLAFASLLITVPTGISSN